MRDRTRYKNWEELQQAAKAIGWVPRTELGHPGIVNDRIVLREEAISIYEARGLTVTTTPGYDVAWPVIIEMIDEGRVLQPWTGHITLAYQKIMDDARVVWAFTNAHDALVFRMKCQG